MSALSGFETGQGAAAELPSQYLTFMLGREIFAIGILGIKEIIEYGEVSSVPMMPPFVRGVINLRGAVVPVTDLAARFSRPPTAVTRRTCIVIVDLETSAGSQVTGVMVDAVNEVIDSAEEQIKPVPAFGAGVPSECIAGMAEVNDGFVILLDLKAVLSGETPNTPAVLPDDGVP